MIINITVGDLYSTILTPDAISVVKHVCRARPKGYQFMPGYRQHRWDGYISLMNGFNKFPTGLLSVAVEALKSKDFDVCINNDSRIAVPMSKTITNDFLEGVTLRDYQVEAANKLLQERRGIAKMATNSGKTEIIAAIVKAIGKRAIVVTHRKELMHQTSIRLHERTGMKIGIIGGGIYDPADVTVCMVQTLHNMLGKGKFNIFDDNIVVVVDECHHVSSGQMMDVLFKLPGCYRYGFSGTPLKHIDLADMKLIAATGEILYELTNEELISNGYSAEPIVKLYTLYKNDVWDMDYSDAYTDLIVENDERNTVICDIANKSKGVTLVLVNRLQHGELLVDAIKDSVFVHGSLPIEERLDVLRRMQSEPGVYIATPIFDEGIDVPAIDNVILAGGGKSYVKLLQRIGRGLRRKSGDNILTVYDFIDDTNKYLFEHSEKRIKVYESENFRREIVR